MSASQLAGILRRLMRWRDGDGLAGALAGCRHLGRWSFDRCPSCCCCCCCW